MRLAPLAFLALVASPALADYPEAVKTRILPIAAAFHAAAEALAQSARGSCNPDDLRAPFDAAFDAWLPLQILRFGPAETGGLNAAVAFWPDPKGLGLKAQKAMLASGQVDLADQSVAARGLSGLERLLWPKAPLAGDTCGLIRATTADLAEVAGKIDTAWQAESLRLLTPGAEGNTAWHTGQEVRQALYTQIQAALETLRDGRIGRPLGSFDRPRPDLAESSASGRSRANILGTLVALRALTEALSPDVPLTLDAFDRAIRAARAVDFAALDRPEGRLKLEILQQSVDALRDQAKAELAVELDVSLGFNAADGD